VTVGAVQVFIVILSLWPPCVADADIIFFSFCGFFCLSSFFFFLT